MRFWTRGNLRVRSHLSYGTVDFSSPFSSSYTSQGPWNLPLPASSAPTEVSHHAVDIRLQAPPMLYRRFALVITIWVLRHAIIVAFQVVTLIARERH